MLQTLYFICLLYYDSFWLQGYLLFCPVFLKIHTSPLNALYQVDSPCKSLTYKLSSICSRAQSLGLTSSFFLWSLIKGYYCIWFFLTLSTSSNVLSLMSYLCQSFLSDSEMFHSCPSLVYHDWPNSCNP